ncbi:MAG TPA: phosphotransferase [Streptosporangiaceae bacterium]|nr:phosphotransferase [Streptosporangiaceae bacterium]
MSHPDPGGTPFTTAALTPDELAELAVSEAGQHSPEAGQQSPVAGWSVTPIGYDWGSPATAGLWRVDVRVVREPGALATRSFFVKLLRHPRLWPGLAMLPDEQSRLGFVEYFPWRFELDMCTSGIEAALPPGLRMPVLHKVKHADAEHIALWFEFVEQQPGRWQLADYRRAAYLLARLAARRRDGAAVNAGLPAICRVGLPGESLRFYARNRMTHGTLPALLDPELWRHPVIEAASRQVGDPSLAGDIRELADRLPAILDMLAALPQTHAHGDASPQNLLRPAGEPGTLVVIDWGFGDLLPIGFDLGQLLVGLAHAGETDADELAAIDAAIMPRYLDGLADERYDVDPALVRAGYLGGLTVRSALCALPLEQLSGVPTDELVALFAARLRLTRVMVDLAKEVRPRPLARTPAGRV